MMRVIRSSVMGFCEGVRRAVAMARQEAVHSDGRVYTLGPLIHNPAVLADLAKQGVKVLDEGEKPPPGSTVIIRAHGISPQAEVVLRKRNLRVLDATCPHVRANQKTAESFAERGYAVFLAGEKDHGEIAGIRGFVEPAAACFVVVNSAEAKARAGELYKDDSSARTALIGQTTISHEEYRAIGEEIRKIFPDLEIADTICGAAAGRQTALRELCGQVDAVIIAGGKKSANTRRLLSLAADMGKPAWLVETPDDLPPEVFSHETAGICAGASTPDELVNEIEKALLAK